MHVFTGIIRTTELLLVLDCCLSYFTSRCHRGTHSFLFFIFLPFLSISGSLFLVEVALDLASCDVHLRLECSVVVGVHEY